MTTRTSSPSIIRNRHRLFHYHFAPTLRPPIVLPFLAPWYPRLIIPAPWHLPPEVTQAFARWENIQCTIISPHPRLENPYNQEDVIKVRTPLWGKIPRPPREYHQALAAAERLRFRPQRWYYRRKIMSARKCPLVNYSECFYWCPRPAEQKEPRQWRTYMPYMAKEVSEIEAVVPNTEVVDWAKWKKSWNRRRPCTRSPGCVFRGPVDEASVLEYRKRRANNRVRKIKQFVYRWMAWESSET